MAFVDDLGVAKGDQEPKGFVDDLNLSGEKSTDTAWERAKRVVSEDIPRLLTLKRPSGPPVAFAPPEEAMLAGAEGAAPVVEPVSAAPTPPPVASVPPAQPVEAQGPLSKARDAITFSSAREISSREQVLGIAPPVRPPGIYAGQPEAESILAPFDRQWDATRGAFLRGGAALTKGITDVAEYIGEPLGIERSQIFDKVAQMWAEKGEELTKLAEKKGAGFVDQVVGEAVGGAVPGVAEFILNVPYAALKGALEAKKKGNNEGWSAIVEGAKRFVLGKAMESTRVLDRPASAAAMGGIMATQTAAEGGTPQDVAKSFGVGTLFGASSGRGPVGIREIGREVVPESLQMKSKTMKEWSPEELRTILTSTSEADLDPEMVSAFKGLSGAEKKTAIKKAGLQVEDVSPTFLGEALGRIAERKTTVGKGTEIPPPPPPGQPIAIEETAPKKETADATQAGEEVRVGEHPGTGGVGKTSEAGGGNIVELRPKVPAPVAEEGKEVAVVRAPPPKDLPGDLRSYNVTGKEIEIDEVDGKFFAYADGAEVAGPFNSREEADHYKRNLDETDVVPIGKGKRTEKPAEAPVSPETDRRRSYTRPVRSAFEEWNVPDLPTADSDIQVTKENIGEIEGELASRTDLDSMATIGMRDRLKDWKESLAALESRREDIVNGKPPVKPTVEIQEQKKPASAVSFEEARAKREPTPRTPVEPPPSVPPEAAGTPAKAGAALSSGKVFKGLPIDKPGKDLTDSDMDILTAPEGRPMAERNRDLGKHESDPRFLVYLKPGQIGYQPNLSPHLQPVSTDYRLVRDFLKDGTLPERGKELQKIADRYRAIDDKISPAAAIKSAAMVRTAIERGAYNSMLHPSNKISRNIFYEITGHKLPAGVAATQKFFTLKPFEKKAAWLKEKAAPEGAPVIDEILSPDLEYNRFINSLTPEQKETAASYIMKNPRSPKGQIEAIKKALERAEVLKSDDFKKASEAAGKMPEGFKVEVPGVAEKPADTLSKFRSTLDRNGAARIGNVDYKIQQRADGGYYFSRVENGIRISKGPAGPPGVGGWGRDKAIDTALEEARFDIEQAKVDHPEPTETIVTAAVRNPKTGLTAIGPVHVDLYEKVGLDLSDPDVYAASGFITSKGRFVKQDEASKIAQDAKQIAPRGSATGEQITEYNKANDLPIKKGFIPPPLGFRPPKESLLPTESKSTKIEAGGAPDAGRTGEGVREGQLLDGAPPVAPGEQAAVREKDVLQGPVETPDVPVAEGGAGVEPGVQPAGKGPAAERDRRDSGGAGDIAAPAGGRAGADAGVPEVVDHPVGRRPVRIEDQNHVIASGDTIVPAGKVSRINANIKALELSRKLEAENRNPSPEEKKVLAQFSGWGSLSEDVFKYDKFVEYDRQKDGTIQDWSGGDPEKYRKWYERVGKKLHPALGGILSKEEWATARASTTNAHYTSREVITRGLWPIAERLGIKGGRIVEPSAGIGHILGLMPESIAKRAIVQAVELDKTSGAMLKRLYPEANVQITGFQNARAMKDNSADLIITNVPFGDYPVTDPKHKDYSGWNIHNYFIAREIDLARPGGIVISITSHFTLDSAGGAKMRDYFSKKADFVGAVRLPATAFDKSAGTEVVTDILVFRKKDASQFAGAQQFRDVLTVKTAAGEDAPVNEYFINHPEMVLGEHSMKGTMYGGGGKEYTLLPGKEPLEDALAKAVGQFPAAVAGEGALVSRQVAETMFADEGVKNGTLLEKDGKLYVNDGGELVRPDFAKHATKVIAAKRYIGVRDHAKELIRLQLDEESTNVQIAKQREKLEKSYDDFVKRHGWISDRSNQWLSEDGEYPLALSLEKQVEIPKTYEVKSGPNKGQVTTGKEKTFVKTAIFTERTIFPFKEPVSAESAEDAVKISMTYRNKVDAGYIAKLLNSTVESVTQKLTNDGLAYVNPSTGLLEGQDDYLSGNVRDKLIKAEEAVKDNPLFEKNIEALKRVQPKDLEIDQIYMRIGSTWVPPEAYTDFIRDTLNMEVKVSYSESADNSKFFMNNPRHGLSALAQNTWGVKGANALELLKDSFDLKFPEVKENIGTYSEPKWVLLEKETIAAREMQKKLQAEFLSWTRKSEKWAPKLKEIYNRDKNNMVLKTAHTPTMKHYPGASRSITLHPHQKRAVARSLQESTLLAHAVGTGKTYIFATTAMEMRRIGTAKKPMIVVQGSTLNQYARAFRELYPTARVLIPNTRQLQAKNRKKLLAQIATGDWDAVVLQHSTYDMLSVKPEKEAAYVQEQIAELEAIIKEMEARGEDKRTVKQWEKLKKKKEEKITALLARGHKEGMLNFDDLGVDALLVDEAHKYKRSEFYTKMDRVKGIDSGSAGRSMLHLLKTNEVRGRTGGKNVIIATGTPISNTMAELWTHLRYIRPDLMEAYGITSFDAFAANFGNVKTELEETMTTDFKEVARFAEYVNGPELLTMWRTAADVIMAEDVNVARPTIKGGGPRQIMLERPAELASFIQGIKLQKQAWDKLSGKEKRDSRHVPLVLFGLAKKAAIDLRLVDASRPDIPGSKANRLVEESLQVWKDTKEFKGAQVIFSDLYQSPDGKFNLFEDIKAKLIKNGVPANEIAIIHDFKNDEAREALFAKVNDGDVRFVMGGTEKLGVGVNIQERLVRAHHLDIPGRPMDFEQRNGRIWRPGNTIDTIDITTYGHKATMDSVAAQRLQTKQKFINQILRGDLQDRTFEDPFDPAQGTFEDMMASFGNPKVREKFGLESHIRNLKSLKSSHENEVGRARTTIWQNNNGIERLAASEKTWESTIKELDKAFPDGKVTAFDLPDGVGVHDRDSFVEYFGKASADLHVKVEGIFKDVVSRTKYYELVSKGANLSKIYSGKVNGMQFGLQMSIHVGYGFEPGVKGTEKIVTQIGDAEFKYQLFDKKKSDDLGANRTVNTPRGVMSSIETFIRNAHEKPEVIRKESAHLAKQNKDLAELLDKPFEHESDLSEKERRLVEVEAELKAMPVEDLSKTPADEIDLTAVSGLPEPEGMLSKKEIAPTAAPETDWWEGKVLVREDVADVPTMPKRYFVVTGEGFKEVKGHFVNIEEGMDTFASLVPGTRRWNVSEGKTGLRIDSGDTKEDAVANARKRVADLPGGSLKKWMEEHADEAVEKQEQGYSPRYGNAPEGVQTETPKKPGILGSETGSIKVGLLLPGIESAHDMKGGIQSLILPTAKSAEHLRAAEVLGAKLGSSHRDAEIAAQSLDKDSRAFDKMGVNDPKSDLTTNPGIQFMSDMSQGRTMAPDLQRVADKVKNLFDDRLRKLEAAGAGLRTVRENYFPGMWTDKTTATAFLAKRPLKGKESFRKQKVFDDIMEGIDAGLVPISNNPIDLVKLKLAEMDRSIMANRALREWEKTGDVVEISYNKPVPEGWAKINDKYGTVWGPPSVPVWRILREMAKGAKKDLYLANFGKEVFPSGLEVAMGADDTMKQEANGLAWTMPSGKTINIHAMHRGTGRSYSQLIIEKLLEDHDAFEDQAPTVYKRLQEIADTSEKVKDILAMPTFQEGLKLPVGGWVNRGSRIAKKPVAEILNNFLSSSIYNSPYFGTAFKAYMGMANLLNQTQLGVGSAFHAGFTSADVFMSHVAEVVKEVYGVARGNRTIGDLGRAAKKVPFAVVTNPQRGAKIVNEWRTPTLEVPTNVPVGQLPQTNEARVAMLAKAAELAGGAFRLEHGLRTEWTEKQIREWYGNQKVKAAARSPIVLVELMAKPIMEWLVPRQKAGVIAELMGRIIEMNPTKTMEQLIPQFRQAWNRHDARLGQVVCDRLFINNMAKNVIQGAIRAPGWTGGTIGEIGGAPKDLIKFFEEWKRTGKAPENIPDRVAYVLALLATVTAANGLLTYAFTGEDPEGMDWWAFRTSGYDEQGKAERFILPTYAKDMFAWYQDWGHTLLAKTHPLLGVMGDIWRNKDYYGIKIRNEDDPWAKQLLDVSVYGFKQFEPFWIRGAKKEIQRGGGLAKTIYEEPQKILAPQLGIMPATSAYTKTPFEKFASKVLEERRPKGTRTREEAEHGDRKRELEQKLRRRDTEAEDELQAAMASREISRREAQDIKRRSKEDITTKIAKSMTLEDLAAGIRLASDREKALIKPIFQKKIQNKTGEIDGRTRDKYIDIFRAM